MGSLPPTCTFASVPLLQHREIVQQTQAGVGNQSAAAEVMESGFSLQCLDGAITRGRSHQVHALELIAKLQIGDACVGYPALPCHLEGSQIWQMPEDLQSAISELATGILAQVQVLQLRHARQVQQAVVAKLPRAAESEGSHMIELGDARQHRIRHQPVSLQRGDAALLHDGEQLVPLFVAQLPAWRDPVFCRVDRVRPEQAARRSPRLSSELAQLPKPASCAMSVCASASWR